MPRRPGGGGPEHTKGEKWSEGAESSRGEDGPRVPASREVPHPVEGGAHPPHSLRREEFAFRSGSLEPADPKHPPLLQLKQGLEDDEVGGTAVVHDVLYGGA